MPVSPLSDTQLAVQRFTSFGSAVKESTPSIMRMASSSVISFRGLGHFQIEFRIAVLNILSRPDVNADVLVIPKRDLSKHSNSDAEYPLF
jgi:hypothetical protein